MLTFILGMAGYGKTTRLWQQLREDAKARKSEHYVVLVPERFLFTAEKQLASFLGNKLDLNMEVVGFNSLCREIIPGSDVSGEARKFLLSLAITKVKSRLLALKQAKKPQMLREILSLITQMEGSKNLEKLLNSVDTGKSRLNDKLHDIKLISEEYHTLLVKNFGNSCSFHEIKRTCELLKKDVYFNGANFYIDSFFTFSDGKYRILEGIFGVANDIFVTLPLPSSSGGDFDALQSVRETQAKLTAMAKKLGIQTAKPIILQSPQRFKGQELKSLEREFFELIPKTLESETNEILAVKVADCHEEVRFVSAMIGKLVREEGYRFRDFAVLVKDLSSYSLLIKSQFAKFDISCFLDDKNRAKNSVLGRIISDFLGLLCKPFYSLSDVIEFAKQPFLKADRQALGMLENCIATQKIRDKNWVENFEDLEVIPKEDLRALKDGVILPILRVKAKIGGSASEFAKAFFEYFNESGVFDTLKDTSDELAYAKFIDILDDFVKVFGNKIVSVEEIGVFRDALMKANIAPESQKLDQVIVASAERARLWNPKVVFLLGNIGEPTDIKSSAIFSPEEIEMLNGFGCDFGYSPAENEEFTVYRSLTAASDKVFVLCAKENLVAKQDAVALEKLKNIFPNLRYGNFFDFLDESDLAQNEQTMTELLCEWHCDPEAEQLCEKMGKIAKNSVFERSRWQRDFCIENMAKPAEISASRVEDFYSCRFRYFCENILRLKKTFVGAELKNKEISLILHGVLRDLLVSYFGNGDLESGIKLNKEAKQTLLNDFKDGNKITRLVESLATKYYGILVTANQRKPKEEDHALHRIVEMALKVANKVILEVIQSKFIPYAFELELPKSCDLFGKGAIELSGKVDRVDFWESGNNLWIRVIDYKWSKHKLNLEDLHSGVGIQALFYLLVLTKHWEKSLNVLPAGALYMPIKDKPMSVAAGDVAVGGAVFRMNGLLTENIDVLRAMEEKLDGKIIPVSVKNDGSLKRNPYTILDSQLVDLEKKVESLITDYLESLSKGDFSPRPLKHRDFDLCGICEFRRFCRFDEKGCERM